MKALTIILFLIPLSGFSQSISEDHKLLWEITGNDIKTSYLFGTMHTNDRRVYNLTDSTYYALENVDMISLEVDIFSAFEDYDTRNRTVKLKYDRNGEPYTSTRESSQTRYGDEDGMPQPLDAFFQQYCLNSGKTFVPLETVEFQENLLSDVDFDINWKRMSFDAFALDEDQMLGHYLKGDVFELDEIVRKSLNYSPNLFEALITKRNYGMADKLDSLLENNSVFCGIGAAHLGGSKGVIALLRAKGYTVRQVVASYSDEDRQVEKKVKSYREFVYDNDTLGFHAIFSGQPMVLEDGFDYDETLIHLLYRDLGQGNSYEIKVFERSNDLGLEEIAEINIPSPSESKIEKIALDNGGEAYQGIANSYAEGVYWTRVIATEDTFIILKAYGGNKFMNSPRAFRFFDKVWMD